MNPTAVTIDGTLVAPEAARISVFDRGLLYGDGCFEVLRTWDGVARDLDAHLDRLYATARFYELQAVERPRLVEAVYKTIGAAGPGEHRIRIVLTRGPGGLGQPLAALPPGRSIVIVEPLPPQPTELALAVVDWPLAPRGGHGHKTLAYLDHVYARELARAAGADEAVRLDRPRDDPRGHVVEGSTSNIFLVARGAVATPRLEDGALPGIVRARVLALCEQEELAVEERGITLRELRGADELFVTSSLRGIVGVSRLDGAPRPLGPITARLASAYAHAMRSTM